MNSQDKNTMMRNLRSFIAKGQTGLRDYQDDALIAVEKFMRLPNGAEFTQAGTKETDEKGIKKGDYLEVVSATGSGKTRMFGTMAKAMDVPTLIVTPRNLLNKKTREEFCDEIGIAEKDIAIYDSHQPTAERKRILEGNPPPKFVITSYQSLPSLVNRHELDFANRNDVHYRPLIILDEVHEGQGLERAAIINKLKQHVLVAGFTATDAGAASKLFDGQKPIYNLPIVEAIKRHILCTGVRAGTIDVTIDDNLAKSFKNTPAGKEYSTKDLEKFASAPSVLEGAISHHLTAEYEGFGKLSRLPTVFYTEGVEAARYGAERFNAMAKKLGVNAKAAYVSGNMDYAPILEQFKKGEIQAVFNDKLLGMGFDAPNATVCYSLKPSNLRHTVEQQLGRVTRKQGKDYVKKYDQNKVALAFNVRGVGMNPYTFVQVLGEPAIYSDEYVSKPIAKNIVKTKTDVESEESREKKSYHLPAGVTVRIEHGEMKEVLADANKQREALVFPHKTDEWLRAIEMGEIAKITQLNIYPMYESLKMAWKKAKDNGETSFTAEGITLPIDKAGIFLSGSNKSFCIHKDMASHFCTRDTPERTKDWLKSKDMSSVSRAVCSEKYKALQEAWQKAKDNGEVSFTAEGITLPIDKAGIFQNCGKKTFYIHKDMSSHFSTPQKTEAWLRGQEMGELSKSFCREKYKALEKAWQKAIENGDSTFSADGITLPTDKAGIFQNVAKRPFCIHKDMVSHFSTPQKTAAWLPGAEMGKTLKISPLRTNPLYDKLKISWQKAKDNNEISFTAEGITFPRQNHKLLTNN